MITVAKAHKEAVKLLKMHLIASPFLDTTLLLSHCSNFNNNEILFKGEELLLSQNQYELFQKLIEKRALKKVPISKLINHKEFFGLDFYVDEHVLDPRPDTETLVEMVIFDHKDIENLNIVEVGTGSSCVIVAVIKSLINAKALALDISPNALEVASKNIARHKLSSRIKLLQSDLFSNLSANLRFDILLSNPPYIPSHQIDLLEDEVRKHDPICALDGGKDGLNFYRSIAKNSKKFLKEHGYLYLEIGINQYDAVKDIFENDGWCLEKFQKDLAGIIRVLKFKQA